MRVYCKKCDKMVKSTAKKNWRLMYYHVFLLTRRIITFLVLVVTITGTFLSLLIEGGEFFLGLFSVIPVGAFVFLMQLTVGGIRLSTPP